MKVSLRFHNDTYAPGIATYGIDGKTGNQGTSGTSMFFTSYSFPNEFKTFAEKITSRMLPIKAEDIILNRNFINGDIFVLPDGTVCRLIDIDNLSLDVKNGNTTLTVTKYIQYIGKFNESTVPFNTYMNDTVRLSKLTIKEDASSTVSSDALLNLGKNNTGNGEVDFINMQALYGSAPDINLDIKYDNGSKAFVFESKYPIVFNNNLFVKQDDLNNINQTTEYSPVLTTSNGITEFIGTCKEITYTVDASIFTYNKKDTSTIYYGSVYVILLNDNITEFDESKNLERYYTDSSIVVHFLNKDYQDFQLYRTGEYTYYFRQDYDYVKLNDLINKMKADDKTNIQISLINNLEVYIKRTRYNITGFNEN